MLSNLQGMSIALLLQADHAEHTHTPPLSIHPSYKQVRDERDTDFGHALKQSQSEPDNHHEEEMSDCSRLLQRNPWKSGLHEKSNSQVEFYCIP